MSKQKKKSGGSKPKLSQYEKVLLTTAALNLLKTLIEIIRDLIK